MARVKPETLAALERLYDKVRAGNPISDGIAEEIARTMSQIGYQRHPDDPHYFSDDSIYFRKDGDPPQVIEIYGTTLTEYICGYEIEGKPSFKITGIVSSRKFNDEGFLEDLYTFVDKVEKGLIPAKGDFYGSKTFGRRKR